MGGDPPIFNSEVIMSFYDYCIWDFNGTILDDVELGMNSVNTLLRERGIDVIPNKDEYRRKFDFPIIDYYRDLGFNFDTDPYEELARLWIDLYNDNLSDARMFDGVESAIDAFDRMGMKQTVLSASERMMLTGQLKGLGIAHRFEDILGIDNIYGDSKLSLAKSWRAAHPDARVMFIGDTVHDCETAELLGADCFIVCAGHQCRERFEGKNAKIFSSIGQVAEYVSALG